MAITLADFVRHCYGPEHPNLTPAGLYQYLLTCRLVDRWLGRPAWLAELDRDFILRFVAWLAELGLAPKTRKSKRGHLVSFWRYACERRQQRGWQIAPLEAVPVVRLPRRNPTAWTETEFSRIVEGTYSHRRGPTLRAMICLAWDTDCRAGAIFAARPQQADLARGVVRLYESKTASEIVRRLSPFTCEALDALPITRGKLIGPPSSPKRLRDWYRHLLVTLGLPASRRDLFQKIRRTKYTAVAKALGKEAAGRHAGHSTDMSAYYLDQTQLAGDEIVTLLPPPGPWGPRAV